MAPLILEKQCSVPSFLLLCCLTLLFGQEGIAQNNAFNKIPGRSQGQGELHESERIVIGKTEREFAWYLPVNNRQSKLPLVISLHGHGGRIKGMIGKGLLPGIESMWMELADRENFLVIYPQGVLSEDGAPGWNDCREGSIANPESDDVEFLSQIIDFAIHKLNADPDRIYIQGLSNGGFMAFRMAQECSEKIAAVATVAALMVEKTECHTTPGTPVSVLMIYGTGDKLIPAKGGNMLGGPKRGVVMSAEKSILTWVKWNQLNKNSFTEKQLPDSFPDDNSVAFYGEYGDSTQGAVVAYYRLVNHGHTAPSKVIYGGELATRLLGGQNRDLEMVDVIWSFFKDKIRITPDTK